METLAELERPQDHIVSTHIQSVRAAEGDVSVDAKTADDATQWWFDARALHELELLSAVERANCTHILVDHADWKSLNSRKEIVVYVDSLQQLDSLAHSVSVLTRHDEIRLSAVARGLRAGLLIEVDDLESGFSLLRLSM